MARGRPSESTAKLTEVDSISPIRSLDSDERDAWDQWAALLAGTRPFLSTDPPLLTALVELECRKARARAALKKVDPYSEGKRHPALTDLDNAHRDYMALLRELGLTPASAKNVRATKRSKEGDALTEFLNA